MRHVITSRVAKPSMQQILFRNRQAPGDIAMLSAAVRDLHRCYPNTFITELETTASGIWDNNPYNKKVNRAVAKNIRVGYPLVHRSNQCGLHFIQGFIDDINTKLGLKIRLTEFRADLHWTSAELNTRLLKKPYWIVVSGGKEDFTTKWWDYTRYQEVVDALKDKVTFVQLGNKPDGGGAKHVHPPLKNTINLVGKTTLRQAMNYVLHANGVICPITCFMHFAAACSTPAVIVAGGREPWTWEAYTEETLRRNMAYAAGVIKNGDKTDKYKQWDPATDDKYVGFNFVPHYYLHTIGQLPCCQERGCWKAKVINGPVHKTCVDTVKTKTVAALPRCMDLIKVNHVVSCVNDIEEQYASGALGRKTR